MNISYKKLLNKSQLILSDFEIEYFEENYLVKMLVNNRIPGLLPTELNVINSMPSFCYDITSKLSLLSFLETGKIDYPLLSSILAGLHSLCESLTDYMLDCCHILLSPDCIFLNPESQTPYFCYCPVREDKTEYSLSHNLKELLDYIITKLDYNDKSCVALTYSLHQKCANGLFTADDLTADFFAKEEIVTPDPAPVYEAPEIEAEEPSVTPAFTSPYICGLSPAVFIQAALLSVTGMLSVMAALYLFFLRKSISLHLFAVMCLWGPVVFFLSLPYFKNKRKFFKYQEDSDKNHNQVQDFTPTVMPIGDTVLINHAPAVAVPKPCLIYNGNDVKSDISGNIIPWNDIPLDTFPFTIGKLPETASYIIDNSLISRIHARFYCKENVYYVEDLNSSNGTYLNSVPLPPHTMTEITDGDYITFAHLTYVFKLCTKTNTFSPLT